MYRFMQHGEICLALLFLWIYQFGLAQTPRAFYIGHSLSDQIPDMVQSLSDDDPSVLFSWAYQSIPGAPLRWHWDRKNAMDFLENPPQFYAFYNADNGLPAGSYDVLVLTESVPRYWDIIDESYAYADSFTNYALNFNPDIRIYLYEDWHCILSGTPTGCAYDIDSNPWRQRLTDDLSMWESVVDTLNRRYPLQNPICLIPGGQGLAAMYDSIQTGTVPGISSMSDLFSDDIHLNDSGKYYIACIHFAMIHGKSPEGLTNQLQHWWGGDLGAPPADLALKMQQMAWETVLRYPKSCVTNTTSASIELGSEEITIFPNPSENVFRIHGMMESYSLEIINDAGEVFRTMNNVGVEANIYLHALPSGMYFVKIQNKSNEVIAIQKILKQ